MTPKHSANSVTPSPPLRDPYAAPYLTHVITHHGQVTLVPPQNQGRVRKGKRTRGVRDVHTTWTGVAGPSTASLASSTGSTTPRPKRRKPKNTVVQTASNTAGQGSSQPATTETRSPISRLPPPPSYESLHAEAVDASRNDVSVSSSSSSDGFDDIANVDLESQWELDRVAGFTLEERVRREWHRRQAAMDQTTLAANEEASPPDPLCRTDSPSEEPVSVPSSPLLSNEVTSSPGTDHSSTVSSVLTKSDRFQQASAIETKPSKTPIEDEDALDSLRKRAPQSHSGASALPPGNASNSTLQSPLSGSCQCSPIDSPSIPAAQPEAKGNSPGTHMGQLETSLQLDPPAADFPEIILPPRTSRKGKERDISNICDNRSNKSAIHSRPLPAIPVLPEAVRTTSGSVSATSSSSTEKRSSSIPHSASSAYKIQSPPPPVNSTESVHGGASSSKVTLSSISVRDRIARFESMHNRPVPPPTPDFMLTNRVKRKPPPPLPSHQSSLLAGLRMDDTPCDDQAVDTVMDGDSRSSIENSVLTLGQHSFELLPRPVSETRNPEPSPCPPSLPGPDNPVRTHSNCVTGPVALDDIDDRNSTGSSLPFRDPSTTVEPSSTSEDLESGGAHSEEATLVENVPQGLVMSESVSRPSHQALIDFSIADNTPADIRPSASSPPFSESPGIGLGPYTDLDVLLSRLDDASSGNRYEDLLIVSELLGPAQPQSTPVENIGDIPLGRIEVVRRRKLRDGRVKLKLSLLGVVVDRCGICLSQFKGGEWAALLPCVHPFHSTCLQSWLARSHTCPLCRVTLDL